MPPSTLLYKDTGPGRSLEHQSAFKVSLCELQGQEEFDVGWLLWRSFWIFLKTYWVTGTDAFR